MLLYKAWLEGRTRFLLTAASLTVFCIGTVLVYGHQERALTDVLRGLRGKTYSEQVYNLFYSGTAKGMFAMLTIFLGLGGLTRERMRGTALFSLGLPVSRARLVTTQMAVGLLQLALLSLLPALLIPSLSAAVHQYYPVSESLHFSMLWFCCCAPIFAASFLLSILLTGEYTAPVACYLLFMVEVLIADWRPLRPHRLNLMWTMGEFGTMHLDVSSNLMVSGPLPWLRLIALISIAATLLWAGVRVTQKQDF
jgi:ABC-type transport system involved in multi-copper enzyme maturation permease subunit